ncbi:MAG: redoxin domain-containing protein, partial [Calditrichota bacterium]
MKYQWNIFLVVGMLFTASLVWALGKPADVDNPAGVYGFTMQNIDGKSVNLSQYRGKVALVVNVASKCGFTPQYEGLEKIYEEFKDQGFVILGFPANNFGGQEPG